MSALTKVFTDEIRKIEETHWAEMVSKPYRLTHHLMASAGIRADITYFFSILLLR